MYKDDEPIEVIYFVLYFEANKMNEGLQKSYNYLNFQSANFRRIYYYY